MGKQGPHTAQVEENQEDQDAYGGQKGSRCDLAFLEKGNEAFIDPVGQ